MIYHMLIVDDEPIVRNGLLSFKWEKLGFEAVHACNNGREALQWLNANPVELVMTDIKMPGIDGIALSERIKELYPDIIVILLTGYNEFSYAQQAIKHGVFDFLLKPTTDEDFELVFTKAYKYLMEKEEQKRIQETMMYHFLLRNQTIDIHIQNNMLKTDIVLPDTFRLLLIYIHKEVINDELSMIMDSHKFVQISKREWVTFVTDEETNALLEMFENHDIMLGISSIKKDPNEISTAYIEVNSALNEKFLVPNKRIFQYSEQTNEDNEMLLVIGLLKKIINLNSHTQGLKIKNLNEFIVDILKEMKTKLISTPYIKQLLTSFISILEGELIMFPFFPADEWSMKKKSFLQTLKKAENMEIIEDFMLNEICYFLDKICNMKTQTKELIKLNHVLEHIHMHYDKMLSLDVIAEAFNMHPNSFSKWFKETKGVNFIDYLTRFRIDKSRELLEHSDLKLSQIAETVGFMDPRYFGQVFKRIMNLTPSEYRTLFLKV